MPQIDEIKRARELGYRGHFLLVWHACIDCGKERWVQLHKGLPQRRRCRSCAIKLQPRPLGSKARSWKSGRTKNSKGYILVKLQPDDFFYQMADHQGYVYEHRLVMAKHLGRCLQGWELVHHKGIRYKDIRNKSDNLIDNLELTATIGEHSLNHTKGYRNGYQKGYLDGKAQAIHKIIHNPNVVLTHRQTHPDGCQGLLKAIWEVIYRCLINRH